MARRLKMFNKSQLQNYWKFLLLGSLIFLLIFIPGGVSEDEEKSDFTTTEDYEFNYDSKDKIYHKELESVRTEIKDKGEVELSKWNKEVYMTIEKPNVYPALNLTNAETSDNKLITKTSDKVDLNYYFKEIGGSDGFEYEVVLKVKPDTNIISFQIDSENLTFNYQPPLNKSGQKNCNETNCWDEYGNAIIYRPIEVVGSYAVYHSSKSNNKYMTGKAFHIYRPKIIDNNGDWIWGEMHIIDDKLTITINQDWLDNAVYPVTIDPDFGYVGAGVTSYPIADTSPADEELRRGSAWTMPAPGGTANYIRAYLSGSAGETADCKVFINQKDSGGAGTHGQVATDENLACVAAAHWEEFTLGSEVLTSGVVYILNIIGDMSDLGVFKKYYVRGDANGAVASYKENYGGGGEYPTPENPWIVNPEGTTIDYSIYCNYTEIAVDTCTCPGLNQNWEIDMGDHCQITENCDLGTGKLSFTGIGYTGCDAIIDTTDLGDPGSGGILYINDSCKINVA